MDSSENLYIDKETNVTKKIIEGRLYCIYNEMYDLYGEHVYKLGNSKDIECRLKNYVTSYIKPCIVKYKSEIFRDKNLAENILFEMLKEYRIASSREFFKCDIQIIKSKIEEIILLFDKYTDNELENKYLLSKTNKIDGLYYLEKVLNIKRFDINSIDENINIKKTKKTLLKNIDKLYVFNDITLGKKTKEKRITDKITKITYYDQLQKFMADCYNKVEKKIAFDIVKKEKRNLYKNFREVEIDDNKMYKIIDIKF
jgi:hypothetical protein